MLGKRSRPAISKLAGVLRSGIVDTMTSPRGPLDCRSLQSPRGLKSNNYYDQHGGIGLAIVVSLDNKSNCCNVVCGGEILAKYAICSQFSTRPSTNPINVTPSSNKNYEKNNQQHGMFQLEEEELIEGFEEEFTYVTCRGPNKSTTRVYYSGDERSLGPKISKKIGGVFNISSPARFSNDFRDSDSDFLSSCHSCRKGLQGKDIYMYRGEKAFCSSECRQRHIRIEEKKEKCRSETPRSAELSTSPYGCSSRGQIFSAGIVAA